MAEYYYTNNPTSEHEERHFTSVFMGRTLAFETDAGVFSKQHIDPGSEILCKSLPELHGRVLDMGCGWGAMTVMTLSRFPALDVTMADVNERALDLAARHGIDRHALFAHQLEQAQVGVGLLRITHRVERAQLGNALADGGGVVHPQRRAVLAGEGGEQGVRKRVHGPIMRRMVYSEK